MKNKLILESIKLKYMDYCYLFRNRISRLHAHKLCGFLQLYKILQQIQKHNYELLYTKQLHIRSIINFSSSNEDTTKIRIKISHIIHSSLKNYSNPQTQIDVFSKSKSPFSKFNCEKQPNKNTQVYVHFLH